MKTGERQRWMQETIAALYDGVLDETAWQSALAAIAKAVGGQGPYLASFVPATGAVLRDSVPGYDPSVMKQFREHWATKDIRLPAGRSVARDALVTEAMILPRGAWERSEIFNEFMFKEDMAWFLACWLHKGPTKLTSLSIQATHDRGPFGRGDIETLQPVIPHVRRALEIKDQLQARQVRIDALKESFERAPFGVVVLDAKGYVADLTRSAQSVLEAARVLQREPGPRFTFTNPLGHQLAQMMTSGMTAGGMDDGVLHVERLGRPPITLVLAPVGAATETWLDERPRWIVFVFDPERETRVSIETLRRDLSLTRREAQVVGLLAGGASLERIAQVLKVSVETARAHLKGAFAKTGCHTQAELVRRIALGPASCGN